LTKVEQIERKTKEFILFFAEMQPTFGHQPTVEQIEPGWVIIRLSQIESRSAREIINKIK
jgi:hypothetical protein